MVLKEVASSFRSQTPPSSVPCCNDSLGEVEPFMMEEQRRSYAQTRVRIAFVDAVGDALIVYEVVVDSTLLL
jgi:hypothetical protein